MKKYINQLFLVLTLSFAFIACEQKELDTFSGDNGLYFKWALDGRGSSNNKIDSLAISFAPVPVEITRDTVKIPVKTQGFVYDFDRTYRIEVLEESTAEEGVHFTLPSSFSIPANETVDSVSVYLIRTPDMLENIFSIKIGLVPNENFNTNLYGTGINVETGELISYNTFELTVTDILIQPINWPSFAMGTYSRKKFLLYAEVNNIPLPDWDNNIPTADPNFTTYFFAFRSYLIDQENAGTPILEEDGTPMKLAF